MKYVTAEEGTTCEWLGGKFNPEAGGVVPCYAPAVVCDLDSNVNEPGFFCQPHAAEHRQQEAKSLVEAARDREAG